jgi:bacillithiol biosynthesis cysteine-adding enzyme BshC
VSSELETLLHPTALYRDFLTTPDRVRDFYPVDYRDPNALAKRVAARRYPADRRAGVASILRRQAEAWGIGQPSRAALARFEHPETLVVVAGQQPGLFGGPLYSLYKALTAAALARAIEAATGTPVVPIFWIASDDHDFEEVRRAWLGDGGQEPALLELPADSAPPGISVERIRLGAGVEELHARVASLVPPSEFRDDALARLRDAYAPGRGFAEAFARWMGGLLAPRGVLLFDPADAEAKRLALPIFEREIACAGATSRAAHERGVELEAAGYHAQITRGGNELNLFWHGARREALRVDDGRFHSTDGQDVWTPKALLAAVREHPEHASPGVLLRPLTQDHLLPTAAYIGGPAEVAYWAQVHPLYPLFELTPPAITPRAGATLLEGKIAKTLDKLDLAWSSLAGDVEPVVTETLRRLLPGDFPDRFERERSQWNDSFARLEEAVTAFDPSLRSAVHTSAGRVQHEGRELEKKLMHVWKRRQDETVQKIRRAAGHLFPFGGLQERTVSLVGYLARYGPGFLDTMEAALAAPGSHALVPLQAPAAGAGMTRADATDVPGAAGAPDTPRAPAPGATERSR